MTRIMDWCIDHRGWSIGAICGFVAFLLSLLLVAGGFM